MKYLKMAESQKVAIDNWNRSQFLLCDVVLSLTDNQIYEGAKLYSIFKRKEFQEVMKVFVCDFILMKQQLGIKGDYVERKGDVFDTNFNPNRRHEALTFSRKKMEEIAKKIYSNLVKDIQDVAKSIDEMNE